MRVEKAVRIVAGIAIFVLGATLAIAQAPVRPPYGTAVGLEAAKKIAAGAMAGTSRSPSSTTRHADLLQNDQ